MSTKILDCKGCGRKMGIPIEILTPKDRNQSLFGRKIECMDCGESHYYKLSDGDQGNDTLGMGKPDPEVVGGKDLPFKPESCEPVTVEVTWMEGFEERRADVCITNIVTYINTLMELDCTTISINDFPHDDFFSMITDKDSICAIEDQHGEPYCHTHKCGPTDPCQVDGCPHCIGEQDTIRAHGGYDK